MSEDGQHAVTVIAFIGSVFSPYYWLAGRRDPADHVAVNVALYGPRANRWAMTERRRAALARSTDELRIGPSRLTWTGSGLELEIDEIGCPIPRRIRGRIRLTPEGINPQWLAIEPAARHRWRPIATSARIEVDLDTPALRWQGSGYLDTNDGDEPLEAGFRRWDWCRAGVSGGTVVQYDVTTRGGDCGALTVHIDRFGELTPIELPASHCLPGTPIWRIGRNARTDAGGSAAIARTLEDTPFYARSVLTAEMLGERIEAVHESLDVSRFDTRIVKAMLPFRMPRRFI